MLEGGCELSSKVAVRVPVKMSARAAVEKIADLATKKDANLVSCS